MGWGGGRERRRKEQHTGGQGKEGSEANTRREGGKNKTAQRGREGVKGAHTNTSSSTPHSLFTHHNH